MVFNDPSTKDGLIQDCEFRCFGETAETHISGNASRLALFTRLLNRAYDRFTQLARESEGRHQWRDSNATSPQYISTIAISSGVNQYAIDPTYDVIELVKVKAEGGTEFYTLSPFDVQDGKDKDLYNTSLTGRPTHYDKMGSFLMLYPTPDYSQASSLQIFFETGPSYFAVGDTTKKPGIPYMFHNYLSAHASDAYGVPQDKKESTKQEILQTEDAIRGHFALRGRDEHINISTKGAKQSFK